MPQLDFYHEVVRRALEKAGWRITSDPLRIGIDNLRVYIDLIAEQVVLADNGRFPIAVAIEVKSFEGKSAVNEFQKGLGQYLMYLEAVTLDIYNAFFQKGIIQKLVRKYGVNLIVFDPTIEEIVAWEN
jgi:hypothetical protein